MTQAAPEACHHRPSRHGHFPASNGSGLALAGRDDSDPELMKPSPYLVWAAVGILDAHPAECAFVGDSTTDMLAGRLAGLPVIGYANKPGKTELLRQAGADAVTTGLDEITTAFRLAPPPGTAGLSRA
jgi:phosphoglycolate phosphatase-like HAD superfamily hydrolase